MTRVAGLDLALRATGYADASGRTYTVSPPSKLTGYHRHNALVTDLIGHLNVSRPELVILEDYAPSSFGANATLAAGEVGGIVRAALTRGRLPFALVRPNSLKLYATGHGRADKATMIDAARTAGAHIEHGRDDEADAWLLRHVGLAALGEVEALGVIPKSLDGLARLVARA